MRCLVAGRIALLAVGLSACALVVNEAHAAGFSDGSPAPDQEQCPGTRIVVTASSTGEGQVACQAARQAVDLIGRCSVFLRRPLYIHILPEVRHPFGGQIFGLFDIKHERVLVTQEANIPSLVKGTPYAEMPQRDFYRSVIVHEIVHGIMHQNLERPATTQAAYEYPAYALQIESLPLDVRAQFLRAFQPAGIKRASLFSDSILHFDPFFFAARAYEHFNASADNCRNLRELMKGEADFVVAR